MIGGNDDNCERRQIKSEYDAFDKKLSNLHSWKVKNYQIEGAGKIIRLKVKSI